MMETISFSYNWNNKLDCKAFTTIRLLQPEKYRTGETYLITLKRKELFQAKIIKIKAFWFNDLNEFIAHLDTGYDKMECAGIILKMYPNVDFLNKQLSLILLKKVA
jgi:hypothetical protein